MCRVVSKNNFLKSPGDGTDTHSTEVSPLDVPQCLTESVSGRGGWAIGGLRVGVVKSPTKTPRIKTFMQTKKAITQKGLTKIITVLRHTGRPFYEEDEVVFEGLGGLVPTEDS